MGKCYYYTPASELKGDAGMADRGELRVMLAATLPSDKGRAAFESGQTNRGWPGKTVLIIRAAPSG